MRWNDRFVVVLAVVAAGLGPAPSASAHDVASYHDLKWSGASPNISWKYADSVPAGDRAAVGAAASAWTDLGRSFAFSNVADDVMDTTTVDSCATGPNFVRKNTVTGGDAAAIASICYYPDSMTLKRVVITYSSALT